MPPTRAPWFVVVLSIVGWLNQEQAKLVEYLLAEEKVLMQQLKGRRCLRITDAQRFLLAAKAKDLGPKELETLVTPNTLLRWHRQRIAKKYDGSARRGPGRPSTLGKTEFTDAADGFLLTPAAANWGLGQTENRLGRAGGHDEGAVRLGDLCRREKRSARAERGGNSESYGFLGFANVLAGAVTPPLGGIDRTFRQSG